jgi:micrococcal nuclease
MPLHSWVFPARLVKVVDGDTVDVLIDQGMHAHRIERLRLLSVNAPETHIPTKVAGDAATAFVVGWMGMAVGEWPLVVETHKSDVFGRYLALVFRITDGACLNDDLIASGNAAPFMVGT